MTHSAKNIPILPWVLFSAVAAMAQEDTSCFPACRSGYVCYQGQCIEACNPPCPDGERCSAEGECIPVAKATRPPVAPIAPPPPPPVYAPAPAPAPEQPSTPSQDMSSEEEVLSFPVSGLTSSFGYGAAHGGLGAKTVFGPFVLGLGKLYDFTWYQIGLQIPLLNFYSCDWMEPMAFAIPHSYFQYNYGIVAVVSDSYSASGLPTVTSSKRVEGHTLMLGYIHYFAKKSRIVFIDGAMGYSWGKDPVVFFKNTPYQTSQRVRAFTFDVGVGINFGPFVTKVRRSVD